MKSALVHAYRFVSYPLFLNRIHVSLRPESVFIFTDVLSLADSSQLDLIKSDRQQFGYDALISCLMCFLIDLLKLQVCCP